MKRTRLFALLAIAVLALISGAPLSASPPAVADHPVQLTPDPPSVELDLNLLSALAATEPAAVASAGECVDGVALFAYGASVPGAKRMASEAVLIEPEVFVDTGQSGAASDTEYARHSSPGVRTAPTHPPARAVQGCA